MGWHIRGNFFDITGHASFSRFAGQWTTFARTARSLNCTHVLKRFCWKCGCRASQWASHFEVTNVNKDKGPGDAYTYDLEWSPDAIKPPINQKVKGVPPVYIECAPPSH